MPRRPRLDDNLLPEDSPYDIIDGERILRCGEPEHAGPQAQLASVLWAYTGPGYRALVDLTHRVDTAPPPPDLDINAPKLPKTVQEVHPDGSILREGINPKTGDRYIDDLSFEVVNTQSMADFQRKAQRLVGAGVRRVFGILVKKGQVVEWSPAAGEFVPVVGEIRDSSLRLPLPVQALLQASEADDAVARAMLAKGNPVLADSIRAERAAAEAKGEARRGAEDVLLVLRARGVALSPTVEQRISSCTDPAMLSTWLQRAATATTAEDVFSP